MSKFFSRSCDDCYFQRAGLCALVHAEPCPTFRPERRGVLAAPRQARLVARPLGGIADRAAVHA